jgi:hypothetical protein
MIGIHLPDDPVEQAAMRYDLYIRVQGLYEWANGEDGTESGLTAARLDQLDAMTGMAFAWLEALPPLALADERDCPGCHGQFIDHRRDGSYTHGCPACGRRRTG